MVAADQIQNLIPQRPPFVMIDELLYADQKHTRTRFKIRADNIFFEDGYLQEAGLLENIAQTAAAKAGQAALENMEPVKLGYIGAVKNFEVFQLPALNEMLETEIEVINQIFDVTVVKGSVHCKNKLLATCEMKIFIINNKNQSS